MVSNEEIKRRLALKREGINPDEELDKGLELICSKCQTENLENAKFCIGCGSELNKPINVHKINETRSNLIVCPGCGTENKPDSKFCIGCGNNLVETSTNEGGKNIVPDSLICPECNFENNNGSKFCISCGSNLKEASNESSFDMDVNEEEVQLDIKDGNSSDKEIEDKQDIQLGTESLNDLDNEIGDSTEVKLGTEDETVFNKEVDNKLELDTESETSHEEIDNNQEQSAEINVLDEIKKAKELLDMGAISEEEFEKIKSNYLKLLN